MEFFYIKAIGWDIFDQARIKYFNNGGLADSNPMVLL